MLIAASAEEEAPGATAEKIAPTTSAGREEWAIR